jgi:hypothetical protein
MKNWAWAASGARARAQAAASRFIGWVSPLFECEYYASWRTVEDSHVGIYVGQGRLSPRDIPRISVRIRNMQLQNFQFLATPRAAFRMK